MASSTASAGLRGQRRAGRRPLRGELLRTAPTVHRMVEQLGLFAYEVTRVAREVGAEGKLGGQAKPVDPEHLLAVLRIWLHR